MTVLLSSAGESTAVDTEQESLEALINEINNYLAGWVQRLDRGARGWHAGSTSAHVTQIQLDDFERQKRQWETSRMHEAQLIREQSDHLTAAWLQLEAEQRRFLQINHETRSPTPALSLPGSPPRRPESAAPAAHSRELAVRQFHQLRQEISAAAPASCPY